MDQVQAAMPESSRRMSHPAGPLSTGRAVWWLLFGALGPLVAALLTGQLGYVLVTWACRHDAPAILHAVPATALVVVAVATAGAWRKWRESRARGFDLVDTDEAAGEIPRSRFLAALGLVGGALSIVVIVAQWLPILMLSPCLGS